MAIEFAIGDIMNFPIDSSGSYSRSGRVIGTVDDCPHYIYDSFKREATCRFDGYTFVKRCEDVLDTDPGWWRCDEATVTDEEPTIIDIIIDNKELCIVGIVAGLIVIKSM